jgi:hypothetical protein
MLKYLLLILVIAGVWYGWRYMNRKPANKTPAPPQNPSGPAPEPPKVAAEDLKPCPVCGTYTTGQTCGRPECRPAS